MITEELLAFKRQKLDELAYMPGYEGSATQKWNEQHYQIEKMMFEEHKRRQEKRDAAKAKDEDPAPTIIIQG